mgnify:CR=1 FL=1
MAKSAMCLKCKKGRVAIYDGKFLVIRRQGQNFMIQGKDYSLLCACPKCGTMNTVNLNFIKNEQGEDIENFNCSGEVSDMTAEEIEKVIVNKEEENNDEKTDEKLEGDKEDGEKQDGGEGSDKPTGINF